MHFSPGCFLIHAADLQQYILTWTGLHTHNYSESNAVMDREIFHERFQTSCVQTLESFGGGCSLFSDRNVMPPLAIVISASVSEATCWNIIFLSVVWFLFYLSGDSRKGFHDVSYQRSVALKLILTFLVTDTHSFSKN